MPRGNFLHFKFTRDRLCEDEARIEDAEQVPVGVLDSLQTAFSERFADFASSVESSLTSHSDVYRTVSSSVGVDDAAL